MKNIYKSNEGNPAETTMFDHQCQGTKISRNEVITLLAQLSADFNNADCNEEQKINDWMTSNMASSVHRALDKVLSLLATPEEIDTIYSSGEVHLYNNINEAAGQSFLHTINAYDPETRELGIKEHKQRNDYFKRASYCNN